jgi:A/G-specific adenine glycosylase
MQKTWATSFPWNDLLEWFLEYWRHDFPWRKYDAYKKDSKEFLYIVWISEILLQQTQAERVIPFLEKILQRFPTIDDLAKTDYDTFFPYYQWLWYYSRARNILKTARIISEEYDWLFPKDKELLKKLPWVWPYTAHAILWFGYWACVLAWDTNLEKVFSRYIHGRKDIKLSNDEKYILETEFSKYISRITNSDNQITAVRNINNSLMDFSRCIDNKNPENIDWESYPIKSGLFYETRGTMEPKIQKTWTRFPTLDAHVVVILHENHKKYYSKQVNHFEPFVLEWKWEPNIRGYVQSYFRKAYQIEVSVRPIHKKWMWKDNIPYIAVYAQIQRWMIQATSYKKEDIQDILKQYKK